ncbi:MAG: diguanylate cyclase [Caldisericaceae bacterium]
MEEQFTKELYKELVDNMSDGVYFVTKDRKILYWNKAAEEITGYKASEVVGSFCFDNILKHIDEKGTELCLSECPLVTAMKNNANEQKEVFLHNKNGERIPVFVRVSPIKDKNGNIIGAVESFSKNIESILLKEQIKELAEKSFVDELTGIPNRRFFNRILEMKVSEFDRYGTVFGLLFIDIDDFKNVNDSYGHIVGDRVLKMVANTLSLNVRSSDLVARWGGEEFLVIVQRVEDSLLLKIAEKLRILVMHSGLSYQNDSISVTVSIGGTIFKKGDTPESIVKRADDLMMNAKNNGKNRAVVG